MYSYLKKSKFVIPEISMYFIVIYQDKVAHNREVEEKDKQISKSFTNKNLKSLWYIGFIFPLLCCL